MVGTFRMSVEMQCLSSEAAPDCSQQQTDFRDLGVEKVGTENTNFTIPHWRTSFKLCGIDECIYYPLKLYEACKAIPSNLYIEISVY